jgi:tellurite resistance protein
MIACADGRVVASEDRMLQSIARALEIDPASYGSLLNNFMIAREVD